MTPEKEEILFKKYPRLYRQHKLSMQETCMCWGFAHGDGWFQIVDEMSQKIEDYFNSLPEEDKKEAQENGYLEAVQVKEKFGALRVYMSTDTEEIDKIIREAEAKSATTCENCGSPGKIIPAGWLSCLCENCRKPQSSSNSPTPTSEQNQVGKPNG